MSDPAGADQLDAAAALAAARALAPWLVEVRRDLHRHPELGFAEHRTRRRVREHLAEHGVDRVEDVASTGVVATIAGARPGRCVALRADLDALPIEEANEVDYRSEEPGRMHACGHDVHTTILLGVGRLLAERRDELHGTVKLLFEPAEETDGGARPMVDAGVLRDPDVDAIFGLHVEPMLPVGTVGLHDGHRNASSDDLEIVIEGRSGHGAYPSQGVDAIVVAAQVIGALQTVVSRNVDARDAAVVTIGRIAGGSQRNVIAGRVVLDGTIRTLEPAVRELVAARIRGVAEGVAAGMGARALVTIRPDFEPVINDRGAIAIVRRNATRLLGADRIVEYERPNMGAEDFGVFLSEAPGAFWSLGVRNEARGIVHPLHHERFDVDEECLPLGVAIQLLNTLEALAGPGRAAALLPAPAC